MNISIVISPQYTRSFSRYVQTLKTLAHIGVEKSATENVLGEKRKWPNKGKSMQVEEYCLSRNGTNHTQHLYQISNSKLKLFLGYL